MERRSQKDESEVSKMVTMTVGNSIFRRIHTVSQKIASEGRQIVNEEKKGRERERERE